MPTGCLKAVKVSSLLFSPRFTVHYTGQVYDRRSEVWLDPYFDIEKNEMVIKPDVMRNCDAIAMHPDGTISLGLLMALAFKDVFLRGHILGQLKVLYEDDNPRNCVPENLILQYPEGGIECSYWPGYYYIPGYSSYLIHKETYAIYGLLSERFKQISESNSRGYNELSLIPDSGGQIRECGLHQVIALTFLPYGNKVRQQHVNHKDANRFNNDISNLEWVSPKENNIHGRVMNGYLDNNVNIGLKTAKEVIEERHKVLPKPERQPDFHRIDVKNLITGEILSFKNKQECARHFNCNPSLFNVCLDNRFKKSIFKQRYVLKRGSETEWPDITKEHINSASFSGGREVLVKDLTTGLEVGIF